LNLRISPDEILRHVCEPVERFNTELRDLLDEMLVLMRFLEGIGLAAPQVGITKRLFVCEIEKRPISLINPSITTVSGQAERIEGCLSLPGVQVNVTRCKRVCINGYDFKGSVFNRTGIHSLLDPYGKPTIKQCAFPVSIKMLPFIAGMADDFQACLKMTCGAWIAVRVDL